SFHLCSYELQTQEHNDNWHNGNTTSHKKQMIDLLQGYSSILISGYCEFRVSPCSRATEVERMERLLFKNVSADSQSEIILVTDEGSLDAESDPAAIAAYESRRLLKFPLVPSKVCYMPPTSD
ncbi:Os01g0869550, partial [Oryza sativa Japonica Group]